jgi:hypothetical protein
MPLLSLLAFCLLAWLSCTAIAGSADSSPPPAPRIWSGVVLATNGAHPGEAPERLRRYAGKLKNIFGYNQYELIGESSARMDEPYERWLVPSKDFSLSVRSQNEAGSRHSASSNISLFQGKRRLAEFEANLSSQRPLFIRGPFYAGGQLVIVVHVRDPSEVPPVYEDARHPYGTVNIIPSGPPPSHEKERPNLPPGYLLTIPREGFHPGPGDRFGPTPPGYYGPIPAERFGPVPVERFNPGSPERYGPIQGPRRGDFDNAGKPLKGPP